jgi:hypothetical protein
LARGERKSVVETCAGDTSVPESSSCAFDDFSVAAVAIAWSALVNPP